MIEIKESKPSTKERPKPEKVVDIESFRKKKKQLQETKQPQETMDIDSILAEGSVLADAFDLVREGDLTDAEINSLVSIGEDEKTLLKVISGLFEKIRKQDKIVDELLAHVRTLEQEKKDKQQT